MFLVFEGLDGSGGTTQLRLLSTTFSRQTPPVEVVCTAEPSNGPVGRMIRDVLTNRVMGEGVLPYLFTADRREHLDRVVLPALARQAVVLSDRYLLSSLAYQSFALPLERVDVLNADFPAPDATIMIDLPVQDCLERIEKRGLVREIFETKERLTAILDAYERALALRTRRGDRILRVSGKGDPIEVHERIVAALKGASLWPS